MSRLPHNFGVFLGLTGGLLIFILFSNNIFLSYFPARLKGADLVHFGIATHYCPEHSQELEESLKGLIPI